MSIHCDKTFIVVLISRSPVKVKVKNQGHNFHNFHKKAVVKALAFYRKREKCKVNDAIFPSGCEARAINLGNKNMKIGIFTGATSVRSKNIFTDISRYPTGKHEINVHCTCFFFFFS